jgi:hypothetical protein
MRFSILLLLTQEDDVSMPPPSEYTLFTLEGDVSMPPPGEYTLFTQECDPPMPSIHPGR